MNVSVGHIMQRYVYVHRPYRPTINTVDAYDRRLDTYFAGDGNCPTCVIKRKNETEHLEKQMRKKRARSIH